MQEAALVADFEADLNARALPSWETGLNDHLVAAAGTLRQAAEAHFAADPNRPRKPFMTTATHALLRWRRGCRRVLRRWKGGGTHKQDQAIAAFAKRVVTGDLYKLASSFPLSPWAEHALDLRRSAHLSLRDTQHLAFLPMAIIEFLRVTESIFLAELERERTHHLDAIALDLVVCAGARMHSAQRRNLDVLLRFGGRGAKKPATSPLMKDDKGEVLASSQAVARHMQEHFCSVEAGVQVDSGKIIDSYNHTPPTLGDHVPRDLTCLPSVYDSERLLTRVSPWRAAGPDGVLGDFGRIAPRA
eukprot:4750300-Pyramimonas_sp.AAC.1